MSRVFGTIIGAWELMRLGIRTRFRFRGPYWRWRVETAFGADPASRPPRRQMMHAALDYGRWIRRMRRMR